MLKIKTAPAICDRLRAVPIAALLVFLAGFTLVGRTMAADGFKTIKLPAIVSSTDAGSRRQFSAAPRGSQVFQGVPFELGGPLIVAGLESARAGVLFPTEVTGLPVSGKVRRLHLLHGTLSPDKDGVPVAKIVFHYENGGQESVRLAYGVHARDWTTPRGERNSRLADPNSHLAWPEPKDASAGEFRLFQTALENPRPGEAVTRADFVSLFSRATPFVLAATVEDDTSKRPANLPMPARKAARDFKELKDEAYRGEIIVRITDAEISKPATNAIASLTIQEDKEVCFLGETRPDSQGVCRIPYPPQDTVGFTIWVQAPGRAPVLISESKTNVTRFAGEYTVTLKRGTTVGGVVKQQDGKPVAGAQVVISRVTKISPHHYNRVDYGAPFTDANGRWTSSSLPPDLTGFTFEVSHPDLGAAFFATDGYAPPPTNNTSSAVSSSVSYRLVDGEMQPIATRRVTGPRNSVALLTTNALLSSSAEMVLRPAFLVTGTLSGPDGKPVGGADLILLPAESSTGRKYLRTDEEGRFRTGVASQTEMAIVALVEGFTPLYHSFTPGPAAEPLALKLNPMRTAKGLVRDRGQRPIPGARVRLDEWHGTTDLLRFQTVSDNQGRFQWSGAPPDQVTFYISKTNYSNNRHSLSAGAEEIALLLNRPQGVYGRVYDAETKAPIESFMVVPGRKYSSEDRQIRWERYEGMRGSGGEYGLRIDSYMFQPEARVLVEAPGYEPQISPPFRGADSYTNDFALKRGKGLSGVVEQADGSPAVSAVLALVEGNEYGYLDVNGQLRNNGGNTDLTRSDARGRFEFTPKLDPARIFASHEQGFAEITVGDLQKNKKIVLQPWGRVKGLMRVGDGPDPDASVRLQNWQSSYAEPDRPRSLLYFYLKADVASDGQFLIERVPAGEHRIMVEYRFRENHNGETPLSHGQFLTVKAGQTTDVTLGGSGRRVTGRVKITGGEPSDVDWKRDVHKLMLTQPGQPAPGQPQVITTGDSFVSFLPAINRQPAVSMEELRKRERSERTYVLVFATNGSFRVDNVPPGKYTLMLNPSDPDDEYYNRRPIGNLMREVVVPDEPQAKVNAAFDLGELELAIRPKLKPGKVVPSFEARTSAGRTVKIPEAARGTNVVLYFWGMSVGYSTYDVQTLKQIQAASQGKITILGLNLDADARQGADFAQRQGMNWTQLFLGDWNQTTVPGMFGLNGNSGAVLIDPQGRLSTGPARGTQLRNLLNNLVE